MTDPFTPSDRFAVELVGPVEVTSTVTAGIASVTVTQGPAKWTFYDRQSIDCLIDGLMEASAVLEVAQSDRGTCGVCRNENVPLLDTVPYWLDQEIDREVPRCFDCASEADERSVA